MSVLQNCLGIMTLESPSRFNIRVTNSRESLQWSPWTESCTRDNYSRVYIDTDTAACKCDASVCGCCTRAWRGDRSDAGARSTPHLQLNI